MEKICPTSKWWKKPQKHVFIILPDQPDTELARGFQQKSHDNKKSDHLTPEMLSTKRMHFLLATIICSIPSYDVTSQIYERGVLSDFASIVKLNFVYV